MAFKDLRGFIAGLEAAGELQRVAAEVDPDLEIACITDRQSKLPGGGKALLFENVKGSPFPVATNLFGSPARMALALGVPKLDRLSEAMDELLLCPGRAPLPLLSDRAPCREVVERAPNLLRYPFLKSWPGDGGRFITLPLVFTRDPETGADNCGMYRVRIFGERSAGVRWKNGSGGWQHHRKYLASGERMPVAIAIGADPALTLAASLPLPAGLDEVSFAGYLRGEPVPMLRCLDSDLLVPADAELVIEGFVEPGVTRNEGAFGNHTGSYDPGEEVPLLTLTCIARRRDPICQATVVGPPPMEDCWMAKAAERLLLPLIRRQCPEIVDLLLPLEGIFHGCALIAIEKSLPGQGRRVLETLRSEGWLKRGKLLVVVDAAEMPLTLSEGFWRALNAVNFPRDLAVTPDGCLGVDATRKFPEEGGGQYKELKQDASVSAQVQKRWREYGFF
ncbi:UbiD family decarboxylase [Citrifermentans bemidjiense Bem]|uniref:UbiD family decarboxylase n=1 Tax=Citrifermentans bemidjiense (strain ATCC BAA-1014 / DSM 16622 / JCM 12645 / Bem) TaxID=404380 RepID=B5E9W4_CITBB|nr:UbiD family decarboxylase [Citrifermentans bemidjiense]ACH37262.1 UbiD family decarboxylase [Citrifermentans bemidjiense Bem]